MRQSEQLERDIANLPEKECPNPSAIRYSVSRIRRAEKTVCSGQALLAMAVDEERQRWGLTKTTPR